MRDVRVYFNKTDTAKYISHLDLMRTVTRMLTRAEIPLWYTEGFNPHPFLTFALPLSLGIESCCESFDIRIIGDIINEEIKDRLNANTIGGIEFTSVSDNFMKCNDIAFSEYLITFEFDATDKRNKYLERISRLLSSNELITVKTAKKNGKKTEVEVNLKDYIHNYSLSDEDGKIILNAVLAAGNAKNLNPTVLIERLNLGIDFAPDFTSVTKLKLMTADEKEFS